MTINYEMSAEDELCDQYRHANRRVHKLAKKILRKQNEVDHLGAKGDSLPDLQDALLTAKDVRDDLKERLQDLRRNG